jgi:glycosyltransferase involved in cell wall biosynthesis
MRDICRRSLPDYYQASDLVVSVASRIPNTVLEVMACGVPVLVGDTASRELLTDGVNARLCPISVAGIEAAMVGSGGSAPVNRCRGRLTP